MKQVLTIARATFLQPLRSRSGWFIFVVAAGIAAFMFSVSRSDGELINELQLRIRFGLLFSTGFVFLVMLWQACISMRGDISSKRMHMLTAYPVKRAYIYLGKWLGLVALGGVGLMVASSTVFLLAWLMVVRCPDEGMVQVVKNEFWRRSREVAPVQKDAMALAETAYIEQKKYNRLPTDMTKSEIIMALREGILRKQRLVKANGTRPWEFRLGDFPRDSEYITLRYRFFTHETKPVTVRWTVYGTDMLTRLIRERKDRPYKTQYMQIPMQAVPDDGIIRVAFHGINNKPLLFYQDTGVTMLHYDGTWLDNIPKYALLMLAHLALVVAAGLTIATAFTMSVASFVSSIFYLVALSSSFFLNALKDYGFENDSGFVMTLGKYMTKVALFFVTGLEMPDVITPLSMSITVSAQNIGMDVTRNAGKLILSPLNIISESGYAYLTGNGWDIAVGYVIYFALISGLGIILFTRKELDKIH